MEDKELEHKMIQVLTLKEQIKILDETLEQFKSEIKIEMNNREIDKFEDTMGNQVSYRDNIRTLLDRKIVEQKLAPEIFKECFKESKFTSLTVSSKEEVERRKKFVEKTKSA